MAYAAAAWLVVVLWTLATGMFANNMAIITGKNGWDRASDRCMTIFVMEVVTSAVIGAPPAAYYVFLR